MGTVQKALRSTQRKGTRQVVGDYGMKVVAKILDGKLSPRGEPELADVSSHEHHYRTEVKTCSNKRSFGIGLNQLEQYRAKKARGLRDTLYALVDYRVAERRENKEGAMVSFSGLARARGRHGRLRYVAEHVQEVYLLDLAVVESLLFICPVVKEYYPGENRRYEQCLTIGRRDLRRIFRDQSFIDMMRELSIHPSNWVREQISIESVVTMDGRPYISRFNFITLLRSHTHRRLIPIVAKWVTV